MAKQRKKSPQGTALAHYVVFLLALFVITAGFSHTFLGDESPTVSGQVVKEISTDDLVPCSEFDGDTCTAECTGFKDKDQIMACFNVCFDKEKACAT
tara:strand:+ start:220 stop:510 length:291 start_codon:yes stop_codon:yes gene_type:complete